MSFNADKDHFNSFIGGQDKTEAAQSQYLYISFVELFSVRRIALFLLFAYAVAQVGVIAMLGLGHAGNAFLNALGVMVAVFGIFVGAYEEDVHFSWLRPYSPGFYAAAVLHCFAYGISYTYKYMNPQYSEAPLDDEAAELYEPPAQPLTILWDGVMKVRARRLLHPSSTSCGSTRPSQRALCAWSQAT